MSSYIVSRLLVWITVIQWRAKKVLVVIKVPGEELDRSSNCAEKVFAQMGHGSLLDESSELEFLPEFFQLKETFLGS